MDLFLQERYVCHRSSVFYAAELQLLADKCYDLYPSSPTRAVRDGTWIKDKIGTLRSGCVGATVQKSANQPEDQSKSSVMLNSSNSTVASGGHLGVSPIQAASATRVFYV